MLNIEKQSSKPVYEQVIDQVERLILTGLLNADEQIPSVRSLSMDLAINPNTIQKAYNDLEVRKITYSVPGVGRFVSSEALSILQVARLGELVFIREKSYELAIANVSKEQVLAAVEEGYHKKEMNIHD